MGAILLLVVCGCDEQAGTNYQLSEAKPYDLGGMAVETEPVVSPGDQSVSDDAETDTAPLESAPADDGRTQNKTFDDIKFDIEPGDYFEREMLTPEIEAMNGKRIRIRGWMYPTFKRTGITHFVLVRDNQECCFGPGAALYDCMIVEMVPGESTKFRSRPIAVEGTFTIDEFIGPDGVHLAVFHLDGEKVN